MRFEGSIGDANQFDDDGRVKRTGTVLTASAHLIAAVLGSGVLSLAWCMAQLGWIGGLVVIFTFAAINYYSSVMLSDCYRSPDPVTGTRNYTYRGAVKNILGGSKDKLCGLAQYATMVGVSVGYAITASISMVAVQRSNCFHKNGHDAECHATNYWYIAAFALIQIVLCQIPSFHKLTGLSVVATVMSFVYSFTGLGLAIAKVASGDHGRGSLTGVGLGDGVSASEKVWKAFSALGNISFSYGFAIIMIEIQDTLKSSPPENEAMKKASAIGASIITLFYGACAVIGYAAFGNEAPGNLLTGFGFYEPFWLVDLANVCVVVHVIGSYQVFSQAFFGAVEEWCSARWPESKFVNSEHVVKIPKLGTVRINSLRLTWRTMYVIASGLVAMIFPFFNDVLGLIGTISFWPLAVYFPVEMFIARTGTPRWTVTWTCLMVLKWVVLAACVLGAAGSVYGLIQGGIVSSNIAYYVQGLVIKKRGPVFVTTFSPLMMIVVAVMDSLILAEKIYIGGAVLIVAGIYLALWGKYRKHKETEEGIPEPDKCTGGGGGDHTGQSVSFIRRNDIEAASNVNTFDSSEVAVAVTGPIPRFPMVAIKAPKPN